MKIFFIEWFYNFLSFLLDLFEILLWVGPVLLGYYFSWYWLLLSFITVPLYYTIEPEEDNYYDFL